MSMGVPSLVWPKGSRETVVMPAFDGVEDEDAQPTRPATLRLATRLGSHRYLRFICFPWVLCFCLLRFDFVVFAPTTAFARCKLFVLLPVVGCRAVFSEKVLVHQYLLHWFDGRKNAQGLAREADNVFEDHGVVNSIGE